MAQDRIDVDELPQNIPRSPPKRRKLHPPKAPSPPIVISDDSDEDIEEVAAKLARKTATPTEVEFVAHIINLVSDEEDDSSSKTSAASTSAPRAQTKVRPVASSSKTPLPRLPDIKPIIKKSRSPSVWQGSGANNSNPHDRLRRSDPSNPRINKGPPSSILPIPPPRAEKNKGQRKADSDEEDYELTMGFDVFRHPTPGEEPVQFQAESSVEPTFSRRRQLVHISTNPVLLRIPVYPPPDQYFWDVLRRNNVRSSFLPARLPSRKRPRLIEALGMEQMHTNHRFRRAGGSINKILQHDGRIVACSSTAGGAHGESVTDPYNKAGTLISFSRQNPQNIIDLEQGELENLDARHWTVHSIAYDPIRKVLASSSEDKKVRTWGFDESSDENPYSELQPYKYQVKSRISTPHELAFKPDASILAVGEQRLTVENLSDNTSYSFDLFKPSARGNQHITGAIAWGSDLLFASTEPADEADHHQGYHKAFDVEACTMVLHFDAKEAGDALCVDPTGTALALITNDGSSSFLRIYDVRRQLDTATQTRELQSFGDESRQEVNSAAFSPDGVYLALGRVDNCAHVYDCRMLERGVLYDFQHDAPYADGSTRRQAPAEPDQGAVPGELPDVEMDPAQESNHFGVVGVEWVQSRFGRLGLVTGGNDGCVRLWDPLRAKEKGRILSQAASDVACFTIGDPFKGEHRLVVGDSDGTIYVVDKHPSM